MTKSRSTLRGNINTYTGDAADTIWSEAQKNLAINLAIDAAWPSIKAVAKTAFTLAASSLSYALTALTRAPWGPQQVWCGTSATSTPKFRQMRGSVYQTRNGDTWTLEFTDTWVEHHDEYIVEVFYNQQYPELTADGDTTQIPEEFLMNQALYELCSMETLKGHHTDVDAFKAKAPDFYERAERARTKHVVHPLPSQIKIIVEE